MTRKSTDNKDTYLHQPKGPGTTYYARVTVPRTLLKVVGQSHIRRTLKTTSKVEANVRKHSVVGGIKTELASLRSKAAGEATPGMTFADAKDFFVELEQLRTNDNSQAEGIEAVAVERAEAVERLYGPTVARRWYRTATSNAETLVELMSRWLSARDFRESTNMGHRKALGEVLDFVKNQHAYPSDVAPITALQYIDNDLTQRNLASSTIRDRLVSLGGFWEWMASRHIIGKNQNPWKGHRISKQKHKGSRPSKRKGGFTDDELIRLLKGNERSSNWATSSYLADLAVLGMFTGARLESLAALKKECIKEQAGGFVLQIENDKTEAGTRPVGVSASPAVAVLRRRFDATAEGGMLFSELTKGGADGKWSAAASKAFGRYRRACGVPDGTDFHSYRRRVTNVLEEAGLTQAEIARFVGHKVGTLAADSYAGQRAASWAFEVSKKVRYAGTVEASAMEAAKRL